MITSYPVPPQYFFTCPPCSVRWRATGSEVVRYTYACTEEGSTSKRRVTLFKDVVGKAGVTTSTSHFQSLRLDSPVMHLTTTPIANNGPAAGSEQEPNFNLLVVTSSGTILCLDREDLTEKWRASSSAYGVDACKVEFVQSALATEVIDGFFHGKSDLLGFSAQKIVKDSFDPDVLVLITSRTTSTNATQRELLVLAVPDDGQAQNSGAQGRVFQVSTAILPNASEVSPSLHTHYRLHVESGSVQELTGDQLLTYTVEDGVPKLSHSLPVPNGTSFLRLSDSSVLTATTSTLSVYNPAYRALQASTHLDFSRDLQTSVKGDEAQYHLITYFPRLEIALGVRGSTLFAAQLEAPKTRKRKRRAEGLLIDSIGRGLPQAGEGHKWSRPDEAPAMFANYLPGSLSEAYCQEWERDSATADKLFYEKDVAAFEKLVAEKIGFRAAPAKATNGVPAADDADSRADNAMEVDTTDAEQALVVEENRPVDRRWVIFTISRVFALTSNQEGGLAQVRLSCQLPHSNVANYLISAGHLSISNVKSAFSEETRETHDVDSVLGEQIPQMVASLDPTLELLVEYLSSTKLGAVELLASIRLIMRSLDLVQDPAKLSQKLIAFGETENGGSGDDDEVLGMKLDKLEEDLEVTEYHLLDDSSTRARGLNVAFGLLGSCSPVATVQAIRRLFRPEETLSLIHVLRVELVKGGWTARYLDGSQLEAEDEQEPPPDGSIRLIADLLCRCIDSVGPGGWMINDALLARTGDHLDSADFLAGLKLEVSAALEGIQEAVYLRGLLTETVKYGNTVQKAVAEATSHKGTPFKNTPSKATPHRRSAKSNKAIKKLQVPNGENQMLPLGLGSKHGVSSTKVVSGGEIVTRSKREIGHLVSQRVGAYSLERIVV